MNDYTRLDLVLSDKLNEAKDNVKYLSTLEKFIEPLYTGTPQQISDTLPALMNAIKMIHTIARFYNTTDKMTGLFMKITNQMITNCKKRILASGDKKSDEILKSRSDEIWGRDPEELIEVLGSCIKLNKDYKDCYNETKDKIADMPKGKTFDFSPTQIFGKFDLFCRRVLKLIDIFNTIQQFNALAKHNLEGMEKLTQKFKEIIDEFKKKGFDLLDYQTGSFDRYYVQFTVEISHLDVELQNFIDNNFNRFKNIEYSLKLLQKFKNTLKRDSLKHNLTNKYNAILHNYLIELDNIQRIFTDQKGNPHLVRNMPPEAGKIIWARHLFHKITGPISMFPENVINYSEIKKYYGSYNTLGKQLTVYEMWFYQNWCSEIDKSKAALQTTLIVRHEENKKLYVNFDIQIMELIREAKCLDRVGIEIPESARIILLQEEKFKMYRNELLYVLKEYDRIFSKIKPINRVLLSPHVEDLELKLRPGMVTLTWTSMNIDSYLQHVHQGLNKLEQLIINVNDIIENRIENNLKNISKVLLVSLPQDSKPFSLDQFVMLQENYIQSKTDYLMSKNVEVERAVDDLLQTILLYPLDPQVNPVLPEETRRIKRYYFWYLYQALLNSTQNSLNAMKYRICGRREEGQQSTAQLKPFFEVAVQLDGQNVRLNPSLDEIQKAINKGATAVLRCNKNLYNWDQQEKEVEKRESFYQMIAQDKEIVKVILLLTGSIQGTKNKVNEFLNSFSKFEWLWKESIAESLKTFEKNGPTLQDYEDTLKRFSLVEEEIDQIESSHKIGAMELKTDNLVQGLKTWVKDWKLQYAQDLHKRARNLLESLTEQTKVMDSRLKKEVEESIDSLGYVMETLEDIRRQQAEVDMKFNPVQEMYALLDNYLPGGITDKDEMDNRSMLKPKWEALIKAAEKKQKDLQMTQSVHLKNLKKSVKEFIKDVQDFRKEYELNGPMVENIKPREAIERLRRFEDEYSVKEKFYKINKAGEDLFGLQNQEYPELKKTDLELKNLKKLYSLYAEVIDTTSKWREKPWSDVTVDQLKEMEEMVIQYGDKCQKLPKDLRDWNAFKELRQEIDNLKEILPQIRELKKPSIQPRHWQRIKEVTGKNLNFEHEDNFYLSDLIEADLLSHIEDIMDICDSADKQLKIKQSLDEIKTYWEAAVFEFSTWGKARDYPCILNGMSVQNIMEKLEEDSMTLATLNAQRHVVPFKPEVESQIRIFSDVTETLDMWIKVQVLWTSLEAVFLSGDIARQMPAEAKLFVTYIDKNWLKIMEKAVETKKVILSCQNDMLKDFLPELQKKLEICQKSLEQYLEGKRKKFPRFYFVSNPTLLKILSQGSEPTSIQEDFEKLFDAISKVTFEKSKEKKNSTEKIITAITQTSGRDEETIPLIQAVKCENNIEFWLKNLERTMQVTIKDIVRSASQACISMGIREFIAGHPSQIALLGIMFIWTGKKIR
jgi:dynein heavy chain, axonemal